MWLFVHIKLKLNGNGIELKHGCEQQNSNKRQKKLLLVCFSPEKFRESNRNSKGTFKNVKRTVAKFSKLKLTGKLGVGLFSFQGNNLFAVELWKKHRKHFFTIETKLGFATLARTEYWSANRTNIPDFEGATVQRKLLTKQLNRNLINQLILIKSYMRVTSKNCYSS